MGMTYYKAVLQCRGPNSLLLSHMFLQKENHINHSKSMIHVSACLLIINTSIYNNGIMHIGIVDSTMHFMESIFWWKLEAYNLIWCLPKLHNMWYLPSTWKLSLALPSLVTLFEWSMWLKFDFNIKEVFVKSWSNLPSSFLVSLLIGSILSKFPLTFM
jgi:hypothetical protein